MWFMCGLLIGTIAGCLVCIRYLRREVAADIGPRLRRIQLQLDNLEAALNLALVTRYAELAGSQPRRPPMLTDLGLPPRSRSPEPPLAA